MFMCTRVKVDGVCSSVGHYESCTPIHFGPNHKKPHTTSLDLTLRSCKDLISSLIFFRLSGCNQIQAVRVARWWLFSVRASTRMSRRHMPYEKDMPRPCNPTSVFPQCYVFNARSGGPGWRGLEGGWLGLGKNVVCFLKSWVSHSGVIWIQKRSWESVVKLLEFDWDATKNPWIMNMTYFHIDYNSTITIFSGLFFKGSAAKAGLWLMTFRFRSPWGRYRRHHRSSERRTSRC